MSKVNPWTELYIFMSEFALECRSVHLQPKFWDKDQRRCPQPNSLNINNVNYGKVGIFGRWGITFFLRCLKYQIVHILWPKMQMWKFYGIRPVDFALGFGTNNDQNNVHTDGEIFSKPPFGFWGLQEGYFHWKLYIDDLIITISSSISERVKYRTV